MKTLNGTLAIKVVTLWQHTSRKLFITFHNIFLLRLFFPRFWLSFLDRKKVSLFFFFFFRPEEFPRKEIRFLVTRGVLTVVEGRHFRELWKNAPLHVAANAAHVKGLSRSTLNSNSIRSCHVYIPRNTGHPLFTGCPRCIHLFFLLLDRRFLLTIPLRFQSIELIDFFFFFFAKYFETIDTTLYKYSSMKVKLTFSFFSRAFLRNCNLFSSKREILYGINNAYKGNVYANPPLRILGQSTKL